MGIRVSNYRKKMGLSIYASSAGFIGLIASKVFLDAEGRTFAVTAGFSLFLLVAGSLATLFLGCENCGSGAFRFSSNSLKKELEFRRKGGSNMRFDPSDIPDRCPVCDARL